MFQGLLALRGHRPGHRSRPRRTCAAASNSTHQATAIRRTRAV